MLSPGVKGKKISLQRTMSVMQKDISPILHLKGIKRQEGLRYTQIFAPTLKWLFSLACHETNISKHSGKRGNCLPFPCYHLYHVGTKTELLCCWVARRNLY